ncbi:hypothetical protein TorRG33x02_210870 [Trema orientale]|uniref:Uncharacterized protein n=1 Tax=Trema orientale TaxID=63057 RepID=A0A2P5EC46_TREOI|nr:hypothetical protein TorRG33x02_210870 [Trema orientale]
MKLNSISLLRIAFNVVSLLRPESFIMTSARCIA